MGTTQSSFKKLTSQESLVKFASSPIDEKNLEYWNELLSFTYPNVYRTL